ncbi:MAG TPA: hypothetical protein VEK07_09590 [Polyangiaceae bacterium]|nr:hypothetical protein [Polyangiaceae bacterium]
MTDKGFRRRMRKLTPKLFEAMVGSLRLGLSVERAADLHGVRVASARAWLRVGERKTEAIYRDFADEVELGGRDLHIKNLEDLAANAPGKVAKQSRKFLNANAEMVAEVRAIVARIEARKNRTP